MYINILQAFSNWLKYEGYLSLGVAIQKAGVSVGVSPFSVACLCFKKVN